jgi:hypothetical protein
MWEQYKRTFAGMQMLIAMVVLLIHRATHAWNIAATFWCAMQVALVLGAMWAARLRKKFQNTRRNEVSNA